MLSHVITGERIRNKFLLAGICVIGIFLFLLLKTRFFVSQVCFNKECLSVELAQSASQRSKGLMFRRSMPLKHGMLFVFPSDERWPFWMKNTLIPLDIIWLNKDKKIVDIHVNALSSEGNGAQLRVFTPVALARYVVEANAGFVGRNGVKIGNKVKFISRFVRQYF